MADRAALHRDDRLMTVTPVRGRGEARDVARRDRRKHTFHLHRRHVVAFVDHDMSVGADEGVKVVSPRECLNHRDVDPLRQTASAAAEPSNRLRRDVEELGKPFGPLLDEGLAVDEDKSGAPAGGDQVRRKHGLAPPRGACVVQ